MIKKLGFFGAAVCALSLMSGCVIRRDITDIIAHQDYNNYKIQTVSMHYAVLWAWPTSEVWTCQKVGEGFKCHLVEYEASLKGFDNGGSKAAPAAAEAPAEAPAEGAAPEGDKK
ncbi:MAG TPA: hypothetical protein VHP33_40715 [Polyangiaceae bacterium]|nr:hypothetical protein [Polyangiaceae bacterium]